MTPKFTLFLVVNLYVEGSSMLRRHSITEEFLPTMCRGKAFTERTLVTLGAQIFAGTNFRVPKKSRNVADLIFFLVIANR